MADEQRDININVRAAQAIRSLTQMANKLDEMDNLVGSSDARLRQAENALQTYSVRVTGAAKTIAQLRSAQVDLAGALTAANKQLREQQTVLAAAQGKLQGARSVIGSYRTELTLANKTIASQTKEITTLSAALDKYTASQNRAASARKIKADQTAGSALVAQNLSYIPANTVDKTPIGSSFGTIERDASGADAAIKKANLSTQTLRNTMTSASYSLGLFGAGMILLEAIPAKVALNFDKEFASVRRTVSGATDATKQDLVNLSEQLPVTFKDLADIATLGGQLGLGASQIVDFTRVVAELTATTDLSADAAGTFIGRLAQFYNLPSSQFEALASAILKVGVTSVATESQIATIATRLAGAGETIHISAQELIGFSAALASVAVRPYAAAGTFNRFAGVIRNAVSEGGASLKLLAKLSGETSDEFTKNFNSGNFDKTFTALIEGLGDVNKTGGDVQNTLAQLGLTGVTDLQTFRQLAAAPVAVAKAFRLSQSAYKEQIELSRQYSIIADTNAAKVKKLENAFMGYLNTVGQDGANALGALSPVLTDILSKMTALASDPVTGAILGGSGIIAALVGLAAVLGSIGLRGYAGILGVTDAIRGMNAEGRLAGGALGALKTELIATGTAGTVMARGITVATVAAKALGAALVVFAVLQFAGQLAKIGDSAGASTAQINTMANSTKNLKKYADQVNKSIPRGFDLQHLDSIGELATLTTGINGNFSQGGFKAFSDFLGGLPGQLSGLDRAREGVNSIDDSLTKLVQGGNIKQAAADMKYLRAEAVKAGIDPKEFQQQFKGYDAAVKAFEKSEKEAANAANTANKQIVSGSLDVTKTLRDLLGLSSKSKVISNFETAYAKSVQPLTDLNSVIGKVQQGIEDQQAAQEQGISLSKYVASQNRDVAVSLSQVTDQLGQNNNAQKTWFTNLSTLSTQVAQSAGPETAASVVGSLVSAGYSVVNASFLQQLIDATPEQRDAYIAAQQEAVALASKSTADALLASPYLQQNGHAIGADTAKAIADGLSSGLPLDYILKQLNVTFSQNPLTPTTDTAPAQANLQSLLTNGGNGWHIPMKASADTSGAAASVNAFVSQYSKTIKLRIEAGITGGGGGGGGGFKNGGQPLPGYAKGGIPGFASGTSGLLHGPGTSTSDSIFARVSTKEYITRAKAVDYYGVDFMDAVNSMRFPRYAAGSGGYGPGNPSGTGQTINVNVTQNYPTTRDPIKKLKSDAENVLAGIWT